MAPESHGLKRVKKGTVEGGRRGGGGSMPSRELKKKLLSSKFLPSRQGMSEHRICSPKERASWKGGLRGWPRRGNPSIHYGHEV